MPRPPRLVLALALLAFASGIATRARAHCQVPCGIYDDAARIAQMFEDTETIRKAMNQMADLSGKTDPQSMNQLTRWIMTKEEHASRIITTVSEYFLTQRVKPVASGAEGYEAYLESLAHHHAVMRAAMVAKQNADPKHADALHEAIEAMAKHYQE